LSEDDMARLDDFVRREYGREGVSFLDILPDHHTFLVKLLEYWSGSMKISDRDYSVHHGEELVALESHTCFNQLVVPNLGSKVKFLELLLKSLLNVGTGFGVEGRQIRRRRIGKTKTKREKGKTKREKGKTKREKGKTKREKVKINKSRKNETKKNEKVVKIGRFSIRTKKLK